MGSNRKLEELFREFDAYEDEDLMEAIEEAYKLGCKEGKRKAMEGGMGFRDDDDDDDDEFRDMWRRGGEDFGERRGVRGTGRYAGNTADADVKSEGDIVPLLKK